MSQVTSMEKTDTDEEKWVIKTPLDSLYVTLAHRLGRGKAKEMERFLKFATVGVLGAIIDFGMLNLLQATVFSPTSAINVALATTVAFVAAVASNFILNRYWTYPDSRSRSLRRQLMQFVAVSAVGWVARTIWVTLMFAPIGLFAVGLIHTFSPSFIATSELTKRLGSNGAQLIAIFVVMIWNFFINRYWTYNDIE